MYVIEILGKQFDIDIDENECYNCKNDLNSYGYPRGWINKRRLLISRWIIIEKLNIDNLESYIHVRHICDNRLCINPDHLEIGNILDNVRDMDERGRRALGERVGTSKLKNEDIPKIRHLYFDLNIHKRDIANGFGVCEKTIDNIIIGKYWKSF